MLKVPGTKVSWNPWCNRGLKELRKEFEKDTWLYLDWTEKSVFIFFTWRMNEQLYMRHSWKMSVTALESITQSRFVLLISQSIILGVFFFLNWCNQFKKAWEYSIKSSVWDLQDCSSLQFLFIYVHKQFLFVSPQNKTKKVSLCHDYHH